MSFTFWFYRISGEDVGPVSTLELQELVAAGDLNSADEVRRKDSTEWTTIERALNLTSDSLNTAGDSGFDELDIDSIQFGSSELTPDIDEISVDGPSSPDELSIDDFLVASEKPMPPPKAVSSDQYFVDSLGMLLGPMAIDEILTMATSGALSDSDRVRLGEHGAWSRPNEFPEVAKAMAASASGDGESGSQMTSATAKRLGSSTPTDPPSTSEPAGRNESSITHEATVGPDGDPPAPTAAEETSTAMDPAAGPSSDRKRPSRSAKKKSRKKKKTKKPPQKDEFLEEIFSEVFTEDGKVRDDRDGQTATAGGASPSKPVGQQDAGSESPMAPTATAMNAADDGGTKPPLPTPTPPASPQPVPSVPPASSMSSAASPQPAAAPSVAAATQAALASSMTTAAKSAKSAKAVSRSGGSGFTMPDMDAKTLGIAGGVVVVLLVVAGALGMLPGTGPDIDLFLKSHMAKYDVIASGTIDEEQWKTFSADVRKEGNAILDSYYIGPFTSRGKAQMLAVQSMVNLASCPAIDETSRRSHYNAIHEQMARMR